MGGGCQWDIDNNHNCATVIVSPRAGMEPKISIITNSNRSFLRYGGAQLIRSEQQQLFEIFTQPLT